MPMQPRRSKSHRVYRRDFEPVQREEHERCGALQPTREGRDSAYILQQRDRDLRHPVVEIVGLLRAADIEQAGSCVCSPL